MSRQVIFAAEKESFIVRVMIKKLKDIDVESGFVECSVNELSRKANNAQLITIYMDDGVKPPEDVLHFLSERMEENGGQLVLIGEQADINYIYDHMPGELIYKGFTRPVDNTKFTDAISDYFEKAEAGEFKKSILIVDDDAQYLTLVREWLKGTYKVAMANSGMQAIKYLGKNKVDLILLDHEMPVTSGPQVLEMLRSDPETKSIPVMFLTGKSDKKSVMEVVALKPEGYFLKTIQEKLKDFFVLHK